MEMPPTKARIAASEIEAPTKPAATTPTTAPGSMMARMRPFQVLRYTHSALRSWMIMIGRKIAAASSGGMISASTGVAICPAPWKPPLDRPSAITAGIASA